MMNNINKNKIMFIMFPGHTEGEFHWNYDYDSKKFNSNFIEELQNLGKVYLLTLPWNYYILHHSNDKKYPDDIDFLIKDINIENYCKKLYKEIKNFDGMFILLGHSLGS